MAQVRLCNFLMYGKDMDIGKIPENILKRSVIKKITVKRPEVVIGAAVGEDCGVVELLPDEQFVVSTDPITGTAHEIGSLSVSVTINDLASAGAVPVGLMITALLPPETTEDELSEIMSQVGDACKKENITVIGGHTEVTPVVSQPVLSVTGIGKCKKGKVITCKGAKPGMDLVATKWIGLEGTLIITREKEEELKGVFPESVMESIFGFSKMLSVRREGEIGAKLSVSAMHDVTEGGIYGALWEMAEASGVGLIVNIEDIPIRQETVEVCEYFDIDPYKLISSGCMLVACDNGKTYVKELEKEGIKATVIGHVTEGNDRVIITGGKRRFLTPPESDEFHKVI